MIGIDVTPASRLLSALQAAGLDPPGLARRLGVRPATVGRWLDGTTAPPARRYRAIADVLDVAPGWLRYGIEPGSWDALASGAAGVGDRPAWEFRPAPRDGGRDFGNANVWSFDPGPDVLVREVIQNSLDAASEPDGRVEVAFRLIRLAGPDRRAFLDALRFDALRPRLAASADGGQKLGALLRDGLRRAGDEDLLLLIVDDRGTVGLTGPERGQGHFAALCRNNLDSSKGGTAGGAFGLGKAVLWRASRLATVLFHSRPYRPGEGRPEGRLMGRCELAWHEHDGREYAGPGWFGRQNADGVASIRGDDGLAAALYLDRESIGTSLCVVGFHDPAADRDRSPEELAAELARAAAREFFPAMAAGRLAVRVEVHDGRAGHGARRPAWAEDVDPDAYVPALVRMLRAYRDGATVDRPGADGGVASRPVALVVPQRAGDDAHGEQAHQAVLLVAAADEGDRRETTDRLIAFRGPGIVVERRSLKGACLGAGPVHALLLGGRAARLLAGEPGPIPPADLAAERFLQAAEPPAHDRWVATPQLRAAYARGCVSRLDRFLEAAVAGVRSLVRVAPEGDASGPHALRELLRLGGGRDRDGEPHVVEATGSVDAAGRWAIAARIRLGPAPGPRWVAPAVYFLGEGDSAVPVGWAELATTTPGCLAEGGGLIVPAGTREVRFAGTTDPRTHPIPAAASCIAVRIEEFRTLQESRP